MHWLISLVECAFGGLVVLQMRVLELLVIGEIQSFRTGKYTCRCHELQMVFYGHVVFSRLAQYW